MAKLSIGDAVPEFVSTTQDGVSFTSANLKGRRTILYFYPKDNTPGCTAEACSLRDGYARLRQMGYEIIGISRDTPESHKRFAAKHSLPFTLLTDVTGEVCNDFGVWQLKKMAGREYMGIKRTTFITDSDHKLTHIIEKVNTKDAASQILALLNA